MSDTPGPPSLHWSEDHRWLEVRPGVESDDFRLTDPVVDGSATDFLVLQAGTNLFRTRATVPSSGNLIGPAGATADAIARFDGPTGALIQDSPTATVSDAGVLSLTAPAGGLSFPNPPTLSVDGVLRNSQYLSLPAVAWTGPWAAPRVTAVLVERIGDRIFLRLELGSALNNGGAAAAIVTTAPVLPAWALPSTTRNGTLPIISGGAYANGFWIVSPAGGITLRPTMTLTGLFPVGSTGLSGLAYPAVDLFYYVG